MSTETAPRVLFRRSEDGSTGSWQVLLDGERIGQVQRIHSVRWTHSGAGSQMWWYTRSSAAESLLERRGIDWREAATICVGARQETKAERARAAT